MKNILLAGSLALLTSFSACAPKVNVEQRANVNFSRYRTYDFADTEVKTSGDRNPLLRSPITQDRIKQAISGELGKRGLRQVENNPDFLVTTHTFVEQAERTVYTGMAPHTTAGPVPSSIAKARW
jgi:hypothetical protein